MVKNKKGRNEEILIVSNFDFKSDSSNETMKMGSWVHKIL